MFDNRIVQKPGKLLSKEAWEEWKFDMENFLTLVQPEFADELKIAYEEDVYVDDTSDSAETFRRRAKSHGSARPSV